MIQATPKADSLPEDLRKHWEDLIADKFPLSQDEAIAYIQSRYMNATAYAWSENKIRVSYTERHPIREGESIDAGWTIEYEDSGQTARRQVGLGGDAEDLLRMMGRVQRPAYKVRWTEVIIDDFRPSNIKEKLKEISND